MKFPKWDSERTTSVVAIALTAGVVIAVVGIGAVWVRGQFVKREIGIWQDESGNITGVSTSLDGKLIHEVLTFKSGPIHSALGSMKAGKRHGPWSVLPRNPMDQSDEEPMAPVTYWYWYGEIIEESDWLAKADDAEKKWLAEVSE